ncbi:MAG: CHAT domain-containing protein [Chitinophaga sp.]|uniref:CHAT domain-containing protein n=1 Tax=Chitinophaga sp. TaxID=1869181 RepID=UPI0025BF9574|nr:CHAT domain-containing protein [Chitinophaga sp.]MBV8253413.1 CHAT domain-containing protein [Chitinophaga sp.]
MTTTLDHLIIFVNKESIETIIPQFSDQLPMQTGLALLMGDLNTAISNFNDGLMNRMDYEVKLATLKRRLQFVLKQLTPTELEKLYHINDGKGNKKINILFVQSLPKTENRLQPDYEFRRISEIIKKSNNQQILLEMPLLAAEYNSFVAELNKYQPAVVHFTGHGTPEGIFLSTPDNKSELIKISAFCNLFRTIKGMTDCVILNGCETSILGAALSQEVKHVIGMSLPISDMAGTNFAETFYTALCSAPTIDYLNAFRQALTRLEVNNQEQVDTPQMWVDGILQVN